MALSDLGWNEEFQQHFEPHEAAGLVPGRVVAEHRGAYAVCTEDGPRTMQVEAMFEGKAED